MSENLTEAESRQAAYRDFDTAAVRLAAEYQLRIKASAIYKRVHSVHHNLGPSVTPVRSFSAVLHEYTSCKT